MSRQLETESDDVIENICQQLADRGDFQALRNLIRVNQRIKRICQVILKHNERREVVIYYETMENTPYHQEYAFLFSVNEKEYIQLKQEITQYNQWIKRKKYDAKINMQFKASDPIWDYVDYDTEVDDLIQIIEELPSKKTRHTGVSGIGYELLPITRTLIDRGVTPFVPHDSNLGMDPQYPEHE